MQTHRIFLIDSMGRDVFHPDRNASLGHIYKHKKDYKPIHELLAEGWFPIRETMTEYGILIVIASYGRIGTISALASAAPAASAVPSTIHRGATCSAGEESSEES